MVRRVALGVRFGCELAMLGALAFWGFGTFGGVLMVVFGVGAPALAAAVWGIFLSPKRRVDSALPVRIGIELVVFAAAVVALVAAGQAVPAVIFAVLVLGQRVALSVVGVREGRADRGGRVG